MFAEYDENIRENTFFKEINENHSDIIKKAAEDNWIVCVPRSGTVETNELDINIILDQVLIPNEDGILKSYQTYSTLSKKQLKVRKNQIIIEDCQFSSDKINILFRETFYEKKDSKYTVWCIEKPLFLEHPFCCQDEVLVLESLPDCIDFLWVESLGQDVLQQIQNLCLRFIETSSNYEWEHIQTQKDLIGSLYSRCLQKALRNNNIREKAADNEQFLEKLKLAVETYMQYCLGKKIIFGINTFLVQSDIYLNKIIKNSEDVSDKSLGISSSSNEVMLCAKYHLSKLNNSVTILDKVNLLDRTFNTLCSNNGKVVTSDDLLQMFIWLILRVRIYNWVSNLHFIKEFKFCTSTFTEHVDYLLATFEAAIEYIKSSHFLEISRKGFDCPKENRIFYYVRTGDLVTLKTLFESSENNDLIKKLCHPLCLCSKCEEISKSVLIDKQIRNERDQSLLIYATIYEQTEIVEYLLNNDVNVNCQDCLGKSALHYACEKGYQDIILLLVSNEIVDVNIQDNHGESPLHVATSRCHDNCVKALIYSSGNLDTNLRNNSNEMPLHLAAKAGYLPIVQILLENSTTNLSDMDIRSVLNICHNFSIKNYIEQFSIKKVLPTFAYGENKMVFEENSSVQTVFGIKPRTDDDLKKINLLINAIKNNDLPLTCFYLGFDHTKHEDVSTKCHPLCDCDKCTKLTQDDLEGSVESESESFSETDKFGEEINVNMCNTDGYTPLHVASQYGRFFILRILLDCGAQVNLQTYENYFSPLHLACMFQQIVIIKELMKCNYCDVNIRDHLGNTPLFYACLKNDSRIIEILLKNDANTDLKNNKGNTVWDVCQKKMLYCAFKTLKNNVRYRDTESLENVGL
ncbi:hypothetical protein HHI36_015648 [Cryptolaemus montrouzieri]|uniref:VPS9 domain-containing protein n=1 Tax=Cryptolaemus montrouzieri TaxID=559131 RepID=A0ABD2N6P1_9CUCU